MKTNSKLMMGLFVAILITSGCVENTDDGESTTSPVAVNDFSVTPNPAPGDQTVNIQMELENTGDQDIEQAYARLFGPTFASGSNQERTWRTSNGGQVSQAYRTMDIGTLNAPTDTSPAVPGRDSVSFTSPSIEDGRIVPYTFNARIQYRTRTTGSTDITVMSNERYQEVGATQQSPQVDTSDGPIQVEIQGTTPHVFYDVGTADEEICVTVRNEGSGTPFLATTNNGATTSNAGYSIPDQAEGKVELRVEDVGNVEFSSQDTGDNEVVVELIGTEGYHCFDMELIGLGQITDLEQTTEIPIEVVYGYEEETSTSVTVEGRRDGSSGSSGTSSGTSSSGTSSSSGSTSGSSGPGSAPGPGQ